MYTYLYVCRTRLEGKKAKLKNASGYYSVSKKYIYMYIEGVADLNCVFIEAYRHEWMNEWMNEWVRERRV